MMILYNFPYPLAFTSWWYQYLSSFIHMSFADLLSPPSHTHAHTLENKEMKTCTLECRERVKKSKVPDVKNVNKRKNRLTSVKLESKKQAILIYDA